MSLRPVSESIRGSSENGGEEKEARKVDSFRFRDLHPKISIGTASDRYAGWIGQVYTRERYASRISRRSNKVGGQTFVEEVLPVESVEEYFEHFPVLEIDFTFYAPLLDEDRKPTQNYHGLRRYRKYSDESGRLILKVPQLISAQKLRRAGRYVENESYLNVEMFVSRFYEPALDLLGLTLGGLIFEQEYQRKQDRTPVKEMAKALDTFFKAVPKDSRYHMELRTESYLSKPVFEVLEKYGVGQVLSHWTWLPPLRKQLAKSGQRFLNSGRQCIVRLMTPAGMRYEDAYARAHPFDKMIEGMLQPEMVEETATLMRTGIEAGVHMNIIINNRAGGNAPLIARKIASKFLGI
jgi:uncharacterized protein YecE (DUF72 family)